MAEEQRTCRHCSSDEIQYEQHFLLQSPKYENARKCFFPQFASKITGFNQLTLDDKTRRVLGENIATAELALDFVFDLHGLTEAESHVVQGC